MLAEYWQTMSRTARDRNGSITRTRPLAATLDDLVVLRFTGTDAENFLQGYLTRDLALLRTGATCLAALTNLKGRVVANGWCRSNSDAGIDWVVHASLVAHIQGFMKPYLAFSRTELSILDNDHLVVGLIDKGGTPSARVIEDTDSLEALSETCQFAGDYDWHLARIQAGVALVSEATSEAFLPQMLGLVAAGAVDFDKGCYLGQEVVARAQHRGEVKRGLLLLEVEADAASLKPGAPLSNALGQEQGTIIEAVGSACIAVVRLPAETTYVAGEFKLTPAQL